MKNRYIYILTILLLLFVVKAQGQCDGVPGQQVYYQDADGDGKGNADVWVCAVNAPYGYVTNTEDCDDTDDTVWIAKRWYQDADGDGYGNPTMFTRACHTPSGYVNNGDDCDDTDADSFIQTLWYADTDGDGLGDYTVSVSSCGQPFGYVSNALDACPEGYGEESNNGCPLTPNPFANLSDENYVYVRSPREATTDINSLSSADKLTSSITYYDGLGRPKQSIGIQAGAGSPVADNELSYDWEEGAFTTSFFSRIGLDSENEIITGETPFEDNELLWRCGNDADSNADGGYNTAWFGIDNSKSYRFSVWVKRTGHLTNGRIYHGTQNVNNLDGTPNSNPYFFSSFLSQLDTWYLMVGVVHPHDYSGDDTGEAGVYDTNGNKILDAREYKWQSTTTTSRLRNYLYYSTDTSVRQYFYKPLVQQLDGDSWTVPNIIANAGAKDIISPIVYDDLGRQTKEYLPFAATSQYGQLHHDAITSQGNFYNTEKYEHTLNPYSEKIITDSPLQRILEQGAAGAVWKADATSDTDHTIKFGYETNTYDETDVTSTAADNIKRFKVIHPEENKEQTVLDFVGYYESAALYKSVTKDENWQPSQTYSNDHTTEEFKDKQGRVILKRTYNEGERHDTQYVYDDYGNLAYVIPPTASDALVTSLGSGRLATDVTTITKSWLDLVLVDKNLAEEYQKILADYNDENLLNADLQNKYGAQGGFVLSVNEDIISLALNISTNEPLPLKTGAIVTLKPLGEFKDAELGRIEGNGYRYVFLIKNNALVVEGEGSVLGLHHSFTSGGKLTYMQNYSWASLLDVDKRFAADYEKQLEDYPNSDILSITFNNDYGGQGGIQINVDQFDVVTMNLNISTTTPLAFKKGIVANLNTKRAISNRELGEVTIGSERYVFSIVDGGLHISGRDTLFTGISATLSASPVITAPTINADVLDGLCYIYHYDTRNRLVEKKIPGKGWEYVVYNNLDQVVLTQDANMRLTGDWLFTKYDQLGRAVYTGMYNYPSDVTDNTDRIALQNILDAQTIVSEQKQTSPNTIGDTTLWYSNDTYPNTGALEVLTISYYDNYNFDTPSLVDGIAMLGTTISGQIISDRTKTLVTGSKVRILGTNNWIIGTQFYDKKARLIYSSSYNSYLNTFDRTEISLNFIGEVLQTKTIHGKPDGATIQTIDSYTYDHVGRLLTHKQQINDQAQELITANHYDDLGQLESKAVGNSAEMPLQSIDYTYNIRGWLKGINDISVAATTDKLFSFKLSYNSPTTAGAIPLYNGNISETYWKTANDNTLRNYTYNYDALNRITSADYVDGLTLPAYGVVEDYSLNNVSYDKNGNILSLSRMGFDSVDTSTDVIDNLTYLYAPHSNKLLQVDDSANTEVGFKDKSGGDYLYDVNGNMIKDHNKGINILYNHLNLPEIVNVPEEDGVIDYVYDAMGVKQRKIVTVLDTEDVITDYAGNYIYKNSQLEFFNHPEGYNTPNADGNYDYIFQYKDHLGNIRLSYQDIDNDGVIDLRVGATDIDGDGDYEQEIIEEKHYYPFGLTHKGYNNTIVGVPHPYGYNGKEENKELGLGWLDYGARNYEASLGKWMNIDPHAETYYPVSPYNYVANSPLIAKDPDGKDVYIIIWATDRNNGKYGHAAIAVTNYKTVNKKDANGNNILDQNGNPVTEQVADGTYTYYDLWPGKDNDGDGIGDDFGSAGPNLNDSFIGMPAFYQKKTINSLNDLINGDPSGAEGYAPNGVIKLNADYDETQETVNDLESYMKSNRKYKSALNNCSSFCKWGVGEPLDIYPWLIRGANEYYLKGYINIVTPNQLYKYLQKKINNNPSEGRIIKSAGNTVKEKFTSDTEIKGN